MISLKPGALLLKRENLSSHRPPFVAYTSEPGMTKTSNILKQRLRIYSAFKRKPMIHKNLIFFNFIYANRTLYNCKEHEKLQKVDLKS